MALQCLLALVDDTCAPHVNGFLSGASKGQVTSGVEAETKTGS